MILAAGRGARMRPLTDHIPKPLLRIAGTPLIVRLIHALRDAGIRELIVNLGYRGEQIRATLGHGHEFRVSIDYSIEPPDALETGGGILDALPLLGDRPFAVVNADIWTDYPFDRLPSAPDGLAHLVLVDNPPHHPDGDFSLMGRQVGSDPIRRLTYSGIAVLRPELLADSNPGRFPLAPLLRRSAMAGRVTGEHFDGGWFDIGTPERLAALHALHESSPENSKI